MSAETTGGPAVVNALTQQRLSCVEHPHRRASDRCDVCRRPFCAECFVKGREQLLCHECHTVTLREEEQAQRARRVSARAGSALRSFAFNPFIAAGIIVVLVLTGVASVALFRRQLHGADSPDTTGVIQGIQSAKNAQQDFTDFGIEQQRLACARKTGNDCPAEPTPVIRAKPQTIVRIRSVTAALGVGLGDPGGQFVPKNLLVNDGPQTNGWRSTSSALPQELTLELESIGLVDKVAFRHTQASPPASWAKEVELLLSPSSGGPYASVGRWTLQQTTDPQQFTFLPKQTGYARLQVYSRFGDASYVSIGAIALGIADGDPGNLLAK